MDDRQPKGACAHVHEDPFAALACSTNTWLHGQASALDDGAQCAIVVVDSRADLLDPHVAWFGNLAGAGCMLHALAQAIVEGMERPADCEVCQRAWDGAAAALRAMSRLALDVTPHC